MDNKELNTNEVNEEVTAAPVVTTQANGLNALFVSPTTSNVLGGQNQLDHTPRLTSIATEIANSIIATINANPAHYEAKVTASQSDHGFMDDLIHECYLMDKVDLTFLKDVNEEEFDKMIRSQQSKRSRAKGKTMTLENYKTMLIGGVAENLLRKASGKDKSSGGGTAMGDIGYSDEEMEKLAADPEELKKAIRNVQSKKSIMKSKQGFSEQDIRWKQLLVAEAQLKALRDSGAKAVSEEAAKALEVQDKVAEELVDAENLDPEEAKALLLKVKEMMATK